MKGLSIGTIILLVCLQITSLGASTQKEQLINYYYYQTEENILYRNIISTSLSGLSRNEILDFISQCEELHNIDYLIIKHISIARAWYILNEEENAIKHFVKAFENGHHISKVNENTYSLISDTLKVLFSSAYRKYYELVDSTLHLTLSEMLRQDQLYRGSDNFKDFAAQSSIDSLNAIMLTDIVNLNGWPGKVVSGNLDPTLIVVHLPEKHNYFFLEHILDACAKNLVSWKHAERVKSNMLMRFERIDGHSKLRYVFINDSGYLDLKSSYLSLYTLADILLRHPQFGMEFFTTNLYKGEEFQVLRDIKKFMIDFGVGPEQIIISNEVIEALPDNLGDYYVATKRFIRRN
jgi:hypothetical protein